MQPTLFSCPHCQSRLRVQDRSHFGRSINCPDCRQPFVIAADSLGRVSATPTAPPASVEPPLSAPKPPWLQKRRSPMLVAWLSVGLAAAVILLAVMRGGEEDSAPPGRTTAAEPASGEEDRPSEPVPSSPEAELESQRPILPLLASDSPAAEGAIAPEPVVPEPSPEQRAPIDVPIAPDIPKVDVAKQLSQPILEFAQEKPVEVRRLLQQVAEMSAVPVDSSAVEGPLWRERLERPVTLVLKETTVGEILSAVMELSGLRTETVDGVIRILPPAEDS